MATKTFQEFTQGTTLNSTDFLVGYTSPAPGGERKWNASLLLNNIDQSLENQFYKIAAWVTFNGMTGINQPATIHSSYNISSVTRLTNGAAVNTPVSRFQIDFTSGTMLNARYTVVGLAQVGSYENLTSESNDQVLGVTSQIISFDPTVRANGTAGKCIIAVFDANNRESLAQASGIISLAFFGGF